jgi:hypothetical protein
MSKYDADLYRRVMTAWSYTLIIVKRVRVSLSVQHPTGNKIDDIHNKRDTSAKSREPKVKQLSGSCNTSWIDDH